MLEAEADRLTVLFDDYGYRELATQVVSGRHLLAPALQSSCTAGHDCLTVLPSGAGKSASY